MNRRLNSRRRPRSGSKIIKPLIIMILLAGIVGGGYLVFRDTTSPVITITPDQAIISAQSRITITVSDPGSGLANLDVVIIQGDKTRDRVQEFFSDKPVEYTQSVDIKTDLLQDGPLSIVVSAEDSSLYPLGGKSELIREFTLDTQSPKLNAQSSTHNLVRGGSGIISYTVDEPVIKSGVQVGDLFFPGYQQPDGTWLCLFAAPYNLSPDEFEPLLVAEDVAGNQGLSGFPYYLRNKNFPHDVLTLPDSFLKRKTSLFKRYYPNNPETDPLKQYLHVNNDLRVKNRAALYEYGLDTSPIPLWDGAFKRSPGMTTANFGDSRDYTYHGEVVDHQTHLGVDLAHQKNSTILAANNGRVVLAEFMGIYGNVVIIDHGLGLQTLYSHLSKIDVNKGDTITKGQPIGLSGTTGLAGGDHLHFGVIISGQPVNPGEWWYAGWIRDNIAGKLAQ